MRERCAFCGNELPEDPYRVCYGYSGKPYCSQDCRLEAGDRPEPSE